MYQQLLGIARDDDELHFKPLIEEAIAIWQEHKEGILFLYKRDCTKDPLETFVDMTMEIYRIHQGSAKLLFDYCSYLKNAEDGTFDVSITVDAITFSGITRTKPVPMWVCYIALVWYDDVVPEIFYGYDPIIMRQAIMDLYQDSYGRDPVGIDLARMV